VAHGIGLLLGVEVLRLLTPCFSAQALFIIATYCSFSGSTASGASSWISSVSASILRIGRHALELEGALRRRFARALEREHGVVGGEGAPSWNLTPGRSLKRQVVGVSSATTGPARVRA
jgi:hypothetical protein